MNHNKLLNCKLFTFIYLAMLVPLRAFAGGFTTVGSGGYAAQVEGEKQLYLYDFLETGIEDTAYLPTHFSDHLDSQPILEKSLPINPAVIDAVVQKLNETAEKHPNYGRALLQYFQNYRWSVVRPELLATRDLGDTPLDINKEITLFQAARRNDKIRSIYINKNIWNQMDLAHQVGLLFHEANFALLQYHLENDDSYNARTLTALLFDPRFKLFTQRDLKITFKSIGINEDWFNEYTPECEELKRKFFEWFPKISKEYSRYMREDVASRVAQYTKRRIQGVGGFPQSFSEYLFLAVEIDTDVNPSTRLIGPLKSGLIPRQVVAPLYNVVHETIPEKKYATILKLAAEGRELQLANETLRHCISGYTVEKNTYLLKLYSSLKPAPLVKE